LSLNQPYWPIIKKLYVIALLLLLISCTDNETAEVIELSSIPKDTLDLKPVELPVEVFKPEKVISFNDNLVFYDGVGKGLFKVFDRSSREYLFTYPEADNELQQHDFIDGSSITSRNGTFNYLDYPIYRRIKINRQDSTFQRLGQVDLSEMSDNINRLAQLNDTLYTAMNSDREFNVHQFLLFSSVSSTVVKTFAEYPEEGMVFESPEAKGTQYRYTVVADEARGQIAIFYTYVNLIRFYDFTGALLKEVRVGSYAAPQTLKERNLYFLAPIAAEDKIYVLYLNKNNASVNEAPERTRSELHVYNWQGALLKRSYIDAPVYTFDVSEAGDGLIGIAFQEDLPILEAQLLPSRTE